MFILDLPSDVFRIPMSHTYPPFKNGRYMEEFFYDFITKNIETLVDINYVYIPVFWTNLQVNDDYGQKKTYYNNLLQTAYNNLPKDTKYFTIVQHDDCVQLNIPKNTLIFGACSGHIPLPLIYEDINNTLSTLCNTYKINRKLLCSFYGSTTHPIRNMLQFFHREGVIEINQKTWEKNINNSDASEFIQLALQSVFTLSPRGYGRSSFRFFESILLGSIPIYIYDDINWLPYQNIIDYSKFSIILHQNEIHRLPILLEELTSEKLVILQEELHKHSNYFGLEYMCNYIKNTLETIKEIPQLYEGKSTLHII